MNKWLFTSGPSRGNYTAIEPDGDRRECTGIDLVLGVGKGSNVAEALTDVLSKLNKSAAIPEYLYKHRNIVAYPFDDSIWVNVDKPMQTAKSHKDETISLKTSGFSEEKCKWCDETLSTNGAAKYAHLQKHLRQLIKGNLLTVEQKNEIRSTVLTSEMEKVFEIAKSQGLFKK